MKDSTHRFITRMDYPRAHCWMVRIYKKGNRKSLAVKSFSDEKLGGKEQALQEAIQWRDAQIKINGIIDHRFVEAPAAHCFNARNTSGVTGVSVDYRINAKSGVTHAYWLAKVVVAGKAKTKSWSIRRHGYKKAWELAVAFRIKMTNQSLTTQEPPKSNHKLLRWAAENQIQLSRE
ncbi:hypothetical protein [Methylobacter sp. YRD-M1]|uniref:hypothetical protein n=1 Tax=Methylobacter sp. YRD-M1 TaxID=2911520 RepID=UPI00227A4AAE|nr:hypothetical protein [Methylobacter sp. YRD-M1]WAK04302.1 hypothetical protein LZ558_21775 [Methylobacter sp. YRD-M1]